MPSAASKTPQREIGVAAACSCFRSWTPSPRAPTSVFRFAHTPAQTLRRAARALSAPAITKDSILQHKDRNDPDHASEADERALGTWTTRWKIIIDRNASPESNEQHGYAELLARCLPKLTPVTRYPVRFTHLVMKVISAAGPARADGRTDADHDRDQRKPRLRPGRPGA